MAIVFPSSPTLNQIATVNGRKWIWDGTTWNEYGTAVAAIATSGSATDLVTGTVPTTRLPLATGAAVGVIQVGAGIVNTAGVLSVTTTSIDAAASAHKSQHATGGSDALTPSDIGAQKAIIVSSAGPSGGSNGDVWLQLASAQQLTPTTLSTSQNDYSPGDATIYRLSSSVAVNITGWTAWFDGSVRRVVNTGSFPITFRHQNSSSSDNNRFITPNSSDYVLAVGSDLSMYWDSTDSRIRINGGAVASVDNTTGIVSITKAIIYDFTLSSAPSGFTGSAGTWSGTLPTGWKFIDAVVISGGGGGGSGRSDVNTASRGGGGGASGSAITIARVTNTDTVSNSLAVVIGSGGTGGSAVTGTGDGNNGNAGTASTATIGGNLVLTATPGRYGSGGTSTAGGVAGTAQPTSSLGVGRFVSNLAGAGGFNAAGSADNRNNYYSTYQKGGGGGGGSGNGTEFAGGIGGLPCGELFGYDSSVTQPAAGTAGGGAGGSAPVSTGLRNIGTSGAGGGGSANGAGGAGGSALCYGGAGGGGGSGTSGSGGSGAGGNGGPGFIRLIIWS